MIVARNLFKTYLLGGQIVRALDDVSLEIEAGEMVAIRGPSGSGKSTLMNIIGCLDRVDSGQYFLAGQDVSNMSNNALAEVRNRKIGFVFQNFNLLPRMSALENVELPLHYAADRNAPRQGGAGDRRTVGPDASRAGAAFRRPATARGHCQGVGDRSSHSPGG